MVTIEEVAKMALELPEVVQVERRGMLSWTVAGKAFAWERPLNKADIKRLGDAPAPAGMIVATRVDDLGEKQAVLAAQPKGFFDIAHFSGYPAVLIQLQLVTKRAMREALIDGWLACAPRGLADAFMARQTGSRTTRSDV